MPDLKTPQLELPAPPKLTRDQAAAAWFLYLETTRELSKSPVQMNALIAKAGVITAARSAQLILDLPPEGVENILKENCRPLIYNG